MKRYLLSLALLCLVATGAHAYWQSRAQVAIVTGGGATTTWNPADKDASITLSNGNLTFTGSAGAFDSLRAIASHSTGKYYYEAKVTASGGFCFSGMGNSTAVLGGSFTGQDANSVGWTADGNVHLNGTLTTIQTFAVNDTLSIAVDMGNSTIWFRTNAGNWNNSGAANPATNTGGISLSTLNAGPYFPMGTSQAANDSLIANFGGTAYAQSVPSGFGNW